MLVLCHCVKRNERKHHLHGNLIEMQFIRIIRVINRRHFITVYQPVFYFLSVWFLLCIIAPAIIIQFRFRNCLCKSSKGTIILMLVKLLAINICLVYRLIIIEVNSTLTNKEIHHEEEFVMESFS